MLQLNGNPLDRAKLQSLAEKVDYVVAADGGLNALMQCKVKPDLVIGDLDSADASYVTQVPSIQISDQYSTDLEKAFTHLIEQELSDVYVTGAEGGRSDHFMCNFFLLWKYVAKFHIQVVANDWIGAFLAQKNIIALQKNSLVSLIPFTNCTQVTLRGFTYNLDQQDMMFGDVGISNVSTSDEVWIEMSAGKMLGIVYDVNMKWSPK